MSDMTALRKLLQEPFAFSTPKSPTRVRMLRQMAADLEREAKAKKLDQDPAVLERAASLTREADEAEKLVITGEIWPLSARDAMEIDLGLLEAQDVAKDAGTSVRVQAMNLALPRIYAHVVLRVPGTSGKERILTAAQAATMDPEASQAIYGAFLEKFRLEENELPKGPARPS